MDRASFGDVIDKENRQDWRGPHPISRHVANTRNPSMYNWRNTYLYTLSSLKSLLPGSRRGWFFAPIAKENNAAQYLPYQLIL
jgi:hypothetical protein